PSPVHWALTPHRIPNLPARCGPCWRTPHDYRTAHVARQHPAAMSDDCVIALPAAVRCTTELPALCASRRHGGNAPETQRAAGTATRAECRIRAGHWRPADTAE